MVKTSNAKQRLQRALGDLTGQKRKAAEYIATHTREITMFSLRRIAQHARVSPATLVLLARELGYESYNDFKAEMQADEVGVLDYFSAGARALQTPKTGSNLEKLAHSILSSDLQNLNSTIDAKTAARISEATKIIGEAGTVYIGAMRASFGAAHYLSYLLQLIRENVVLVNDPAGMAGDLLSGITAADCLVVFGFYPYVRRTVEFADQAEAAGAHIVSITDSAKSPLIRKRGVGVLFRTESPWVIGSMTAAVAVSQIIAAQTAAMGGEKVLDRMRRREKLLNQIGTFTT